MTYIDSVILDATERCCHRFQVLTGKTNVWLAVQFTNLSVVVYFGWAGLYSWSTGGMQALLFVLFCAGLLYTLARTVFRMPIEAYEAAAYRRVANGCRNPRRGRDILLRIPFLTLSLVLAYPINILYMAMRSRFMLLGYLLIVLTTTVLYLLACDPLPPCTGKISLWLRRPARARLAPSDETEACS